MKIITISGRDFRFVENDIEAAHYRLASAYLWPSRIEKVLRHNGETDESYAQRIYNRLHENPDFYALMGCLILPVDLPESEWSPHIGMESGRHFRGISDADSKAAFTRQVVDAVINFCKLKPGHLSEAIEAQRRSS